MSLKSFFTAFAGIALISVFSGCALIFPQERQEPLFYDIGTPEKTVNLPYYIEIQQMKNESAAKYKMLFRQGNHLKMDDLRRWSQPPASMLTRFLKIAFSNTNGNKLNEDEDGYILAAQILSFDADLDNNVCELFIRYEIVDHSSGKSLCAGQIQITEPLSITGDQDPALAFSSAMHKASNELVVKIEDIFKTMLSKEAAIKK